MDPHEGFPDVNLNDMLGFIKEQRESWHLYASGATSKGYTKRLEYNFDGSYRVTIDQEVVLETEDGDAAVKRYNDGTPI